MDNDKIWSHISRKISGEDTAEDASLVNEWIANKPENKQAYNILNVIWIYRPSSSKKYHSLFKSVKRRIEVHEKTAPNNRFIQPTFLKLPRLLFLSFFRI